MLMVKAGEVVDQTIEHVLPYLEKGDSLIDGGNSLFTDKHEPVADKGIWRRRGILFIGTWCFGW